MPKNPLYVSIVDLQRILRFALNYRLVVNFTRHRGFIDYNRREETEGSKTLTKKIYKFFSYRQKTRSTTAFT